MSVLIKILAVRENRVPKVGELTLNENGVFNTPRNEEDALKSYQWFGNMPVKVYLIKYRPAKHNEMSITVGGQLKRFNINSGKVTIWQDMCPVVIGEAGEKIMNMLSNGHLKNLDTIGEVIE
jgi:hypothetical protein